MLLLRRFLWIDGRSGRREWWTILIVCLMIGWQLDVTSVFTRPLYGVGHGLDSLIRLALSGLLFWIDLASTIRRLHDRGKPGWNALPYAFPGLGWVWMVIECGLLPSQAGRNRYGPQPDTPQAESALPSLQQLLASLDAKAKEAGAPGPWSACRAPAKPARRAAARMSPTRAATRAAQSAMGQPAMARAHTRTARRPAVQTSAVTRVDQSLGKAILIVAAAATMGLAVTALAIS